MNQAKIYFGTILVALAGLLFWVLAVPTYDEIADMRAALADRSAILVNRAATIAKINALSKQLADRAADLQRFSNVLPAKRSAAELVSALQALASQNGVVLNTLNMPGGQSQTSAPYYNQIMDMNVSGSYPAFRSFLSALNRNIRIIDILTLDAAPVGGSDTVISFHIRANAYFLK